MSTVSICAPSCGTPQPLCRRAVVAGLHCHRFERERERLRQPLRATAREGSCSPRAAGVASTGRRRAGGRGTRGSSHSASNAAISSKVAPYRVRRAFIRAPPRISYARSVRWTSNPSERYNRSAAALVGLGEQRAGVDAAGVHAVESFDGEGASEAGPLRARIDTDHEDLAEPRITSVRVVDLQPVEPTRPSASSASRNSVGSNHGSAMRRCKVSAIHPP